MTAGTAPAAVHEPSVQEVAEASALAAAGWNDLLQPEDAFQAPRWLGVQERTAGTTLRYLLRRRGGRPVAGLATAWADDSVPWLLARPDALLEHARAEELAGAARFGAGVPGSALMPSLVCGGRHLGRTRPVTGPDAEPDDVHALLEAAEALAAGRGAASVCLPHVDVRDTALAAVLEQRGYAWHASAEYCWLDIPPGGFDEYLAGMSQTRRRSVRLERRAIAAAGIELRVQPLTADLAPRLGTLDAELLRKYGNPADPAHSTRVIATIAEALGDDVLVSLGSLDGEIIGFGLVLRSRTAAGEHWFGHRAGFDYEAKGSLQLYYEVLYYSVLEQAAAAGVTVLHAGIGSTPAKVARGCLASEQRSYVLRLDGPR